VRSHERCTCSYGLTPRDLARRMASHAKSLGTRSLPAVHAPQLGLNSWALSLTLALFLLGILLSSVQYKSEGEKPAAQNTQAREIYSTALIRLEEEQKHLKENVARLQKEVQAHQELAGLRKDTVGELADELRLQRIAAGMVPLKGPGVRIVLDDSKNLPAPGENPNLYIIHDYQLRDAVNLLWSAGAESIAINTERLVTTSSIYSSGGTIMVNSTRLSPPFAVQALGDPDGMMDRIGQPLSLRTLKAQSEAYGLVISRQKEKELKVPTFRGSYAPNHLNVGRP